MLNVAEMRGLDLRDEAQMQQALEVVDAAHNRIAQDYGIDDAIERRAASAEAGTDAIADYEARFPDGDTRMADEISADARRAQEEEDAELDAATDAMIQMRQGSENVDGVYPQGNWRSDDGIEETRPVVIERVAQFYPAIETSYRGGEPGYTYDDTDAYGTKEEAAANISKAWEYRDSLDTADQMAKSREADALEHAPTTSIGSTEAARHELRQYANPVGADDERRLREAVERALTRDEIERLKRGDVDGLNGVGNREEQLAMARDYLRSTNDPVAQQGLDRVNEQLAAEREQQRRERGHEGGGHE